MNHTTQVRTVEAWDNEGGLGPPGAVWLENEQAWNFTLYSRHASGVSLLLYSATDFVKPLFKLELNPLKNKTGRVWHCLVVAAIGACGEILRLPSCRVRGTLRWDIASTQTRMLFDPYAEELFFPPEFSREASLTNSSDILSRHQHPRGRVCVSTSPPLL